MLARGLARSPHPAHAAGGGGVRTVPGVSWPSSIPPAFSHLRISRTICRRPTQCLKLDRPTTADCIEACPGLDPEESGKVGVQYPVNLSLVDPARQRTRRTVLSAPGPKSAAEPQEILGSGPRYRIGSGRSPGRRQGGTRSCWPRGPDMRKRNAPSRQPRSALILRRMMVWPSWHWRTAPSDNA